MSAAVNFRSALSERNKMVAWKAFGACMEDDFSLYESLIIFFCLGTQLLPNLNTKQEVLGMRREKRSTYC